MDGKFDFYLNYFYFFFTFFPPMKRIIALYSATQHE